MFRTVRQHDVTRWRALRHHHALPKLLVLGIFASIRSWRFDLFDGSDVLTVVDHASNRVPADIELGIDSVLLESHIAWDIGTAELAGALGYPAFLASISRLVTDFNREEGSPDRIPLVSDGIEIPGNLHCGAERDGYWRDYHASLAATIASRRPKLLLSLHSFTPALSSRPDEKRPWQVGVLYNQDARAARVALAKLCDAGVIVGDQLPYSGKLLNATMNLHGEKTSTPYLGLEVRQDLIGDETGVARWARILRPVIDEVRATFT